MTANKSLTLEECIEAFANLLDGDAAYCDGDVMISFESHGKALAAMRQARNALATMRRVSSGEAIGTCRARAAADKIRAGVKEGEA